MAVKMATFAACHHSAQKKPASTHAATQTHVTCDEVASATGLVNPHISITAVETPQVVGSFLLSEDFASPVYNQVNQEQIVTACSRAPVFEHVAPALVIEYIAPAPAMTYAAPSQKYPPVYTTTTDTADDNFDTTDLVHPQISFPVLRLLRHRSFVLFLLEKSLMRPCTTNSITNRLMQGRRLRT